MQAYTMIDTLLKDRDYTVIVAKTAIGIRVTPPGFEQRWLAAQSAVIALAEKCQEFDPDGITIYISSKNQIPPFRKYEQVTTERLEPIFRENYPPDELNLFEVLKLALDDFLARKAANQTKPNGEIMLVLIDGEPKDRMAIVKLIVNATQNLNQDKELGIGFVQIGDDVITRGFLAALDEDLQGAGAKFDIVDTKVLAEVDPNSLIELLNDTLSD
jgi:hypothetical protein